MKDPDDFCPCYVRAKDGHLWSRWGSGIKVAERDYIILNMVTGPVTDRESRFYRDVTEL